MGNRRRIETVRRQRRSVWELGAFRYIMAREEENRLRHWEGQYFLERLEPEIKVFRFEKSEEYYKNLSEAEKSEEVKNIKNGINFAKKVLSTGECDLLILDEVLGLVDYGVIESKELENLISVRLDDMELILTGRKLNDSLRSHADEIYHLIPED